MRRYFHCCIIIVTLVAFSACHSVPDHAKYIPKDALLVVGLNTKSLGKKVAWQALMGSKLFKELQAHMPDKQAMNKLEEAGIDGMNTFYVFMKNDKRFSAKITALIPLADAGKWEAYVKNTFPEAAIHQQADRKEGELYSGMYAGWNNKLLIVMNIQPEIRFGARDTITVVASSDGAADTAITNEPQAITVDAAILAAEMEVAFTTSKENALIENKHFKKLEKDNHDIVFWMNYDQVMSSIGNNGMAPQASGTLAMTRNLWKGAAFAGGFDFDKGSINGDLRYYASDALKEISKDLGSDNVDKDLLNRLPAANLDALMAFHMSPRGTKMTLEKTGMLGLANLALSSQNLSVEYILDAFTGDMAVVLNDFAVAQKSATTTVTTADTNSNISYTADYKPSFNAVYAMKINKEENFKRLLSLFVRNGLTTIAPNTYAVPLGTTDSIYLMTDNKYLVASNRLANATAFLQNTNKDKLPDASQAYGHPFAMYFDVQQLVKNINVNASMGDAQNTAKIEAAKKLITDVVFNGGQFKDDAFQYKMAINFSNKEENSILVLLDFAMKMSAKEKNDLTSYNSDKVMAN